MARGDGAEVPESEGVSAGADLLRRDVARRDATEETVGHDDGNLLRDDSAARFLWDARNAESARARAREHWIRQQAREAATFDGILRALSERASPVTAWTSDGGTATGPIATVSRELVRISGPQGRDTWLVRRSLAALSATSDGVDAGVASDDRGPTSTLTLTGLLAELAEERAAVVARSGGTEIAGRVAGSGTDVVTLRLQGGRLAYIPVTGLSLLRLT